MLEYFPLDNEKMTEYFFYQKNIKHLAVAII